MPLTSSAHASSNQDLSEHRNTGEFKMAFHFCRNFSQYTISGFLQYTILVFAETCSNLLVNLFTTVLCMKQLRIDVKQMVQ